MQYSRGGPIVAVQVENEYGACATDQEYMPFIKEVGGHIFYLINKKTFFTKCLFTTSQPIYFPVLSAVLLLPHCFSLFLFFLFENPQSYFCSLLFLFTCFFKPLVLQALLSRGVTELLLTSDGSDGLKFGGVEGGTVG